VTVLAGVDGAGCQHGCCWGCFGSTPQRAASPGPCQAAGNKLGIPARALSCSSRAAPLVPGLGSGCRSCAEDPAASAPSLPGAHVADGHDPASLASPARGHGACVGLRPQRRPRRAGLELTEGGGGSLAPVEASLCRLGGLPRSDEPRGPRSLACPSQG